MGVLKPEIMHLSSFDKDNLFYTDKPQYLALLNTLHIPIDFKHDNEEITRENDEWKNSDNPSFLSSSNDLLPVKENETNLRNGKYLQKRRSKEEKLIMKHGKLKEKRLEYSARLKIRNTDAWNLMTEEQQNDQKKNRKLQTQLSEDVRVNKCCVVLSVVLYSGTVFS